MVRQILFLIISFLFLSLDLSSQCAMCKAVVEANLEAGGTKHHSDLLKPFGLDASDPEFWNKGLNVITGMIDELEKID